MKPKTPEWNAGSKSREKYTTTMVYFMSALHYSERRGVVAALAFSSCYYILAYKNYFIVFLWHNKVSVLGSLRNGCMV